MQKGFFASLFDFSFSSLITTKIIKVLYVISMIVIGLGALLFTLAAFRASAVFGVVTLIILAPLGSLIYVIYTRVILEVLIALFRIMENTQELVAQGGLPGSAPASGAVSDAPKPGLGPSSSASPPATPGSFPLQR